MPASTRVAVLALLALLAATATGRAQGDDAAKQLADRYAPIVVVRDQDAPCDRDGEAYRPVPVETVLDKPEVSLLDDDGDVITKGPGMAEIVGKGPKTSLDFPGNPRRPGCGFEEDFKRFAAGEPNVAYAHVGTDPSAPRKLALQYWFFWYFDDYVNTHEGDWEFVQLVWDVATAEEALGTPPVATGYSQHSGGESADWDGDKLERSGDHPVVYAAAGSHANFYTPDLFLGRSADQGFGCDNARPPGTRLQTEARLLPSGQVDPSGPDAWLLFQGRWGEFQPSPYDAPPGPRTKEEWSAPIAWQDSLRDGSFAVPSGGSIPVTATGAFCWTVRAGGRVYTAVTSPVVLLLIVLGLVSTAGLAVRSTAWSPRMPHPLRRVRESGQILRAGWAAYREHRRVLLAIGALFVPAALVEVAAQAIVLWLTPLGHLTDVAGDDSLVSAVVVFLVAGAGYVLAATAVTGGAAIVLHAAEPGPPPTIRESYRMLGHRVGKLLMTSIRITAAVIALTVTIVGIPWAILLLGRWAVAVQVAAIEGTSSAEALRRSRELTHHRWSRAARLGALVNVIGTISGPIIGIVLLFVSGLPLEAINAVSSLVFVAIIPYVGTCLALLYGDLVARRALDEEDA